MRAGGQQKIPRPSAWEKGSPAPWAGLDLTPLTSLTHVVSQISAHSAQTAATESMPDARVSAVLVNLFQGTSGVEVVLTKRAAHLKNHKGEISCPGGRVEPDEQVHEAALREAVEEVSLPAHDVTLVGELDHLLTIVSNSYIVPIVGVLPYKPILTASADEVDRILHVPLHELARTDTYASEVWELPMGMRTIFMYHLDDETIWGATARVLTQLLQVSLGIDI
jgi:8-oxo-dGTP pyrophosphatase MutT (NUDIX family)